LSCLSFEMYSGPKMEEMQSSGTSSLISISYFQYLILLMASYTARVDDIVMTMSLRIIPPHSGMGCFK
jgi:hypothetical protein